MRRNLFIAAMSLLVMAGCTEGSDELDKIQPQGQDNAIQFTTYVGQQTKATAINAFGNNSTIKVLAHYSTTSTGKTDTDFTADYMNTDLTTTDGTSWIYDGYAYWPKNDDVIDFVAYSPSTGITSKVLTDAAQKGQIEINGYTLNNAQELLYAATPNQNSSSNNEKVKLAFKHALAQVTYKAKLATNVKTDISITKVEYITSIPTTDGTCIISNIYSTPIVSWTAGTTATESIITSEAKSLSESSPTVDLTTASFVIPTSSSQYQVKITYTYKPSSIMDAKETSETFTLPAWSAGKKHTYTFVINMAKVNMETEVDSDWGTGSDQEIEQN